MRGEIVLGHRHRLALPIKSYVIDGLRFGSERDSNQHISLSTTNRPYTNKHLLKPPDVLHEQRRVERVGVVEVRLGAFLVRQVAEVLVVRVVRQVGHVRRPQRLVERAGEGRLACVVWCVV